MIMTLAELRQLLATEEADTALAARLQALELLIRAYTNNSFQQRAFRCNASAVTAGDTGESTLLCDRALPFREGDTLQITGSQLQPDVLVTVSSVSGSTVTVKEALFDEEGVTVTKVAYPADIKLGVANMLKWQIENGDKVGVASETVSRHSVTYFNMDGDNSSMGFPKSLLGFLKPYRKARFGQGGGG